MPSGSKICDGSSTKSRSTAFPTGFVGHLRQQAVQAVSEFVEQRSNVSSADSSVGSPGGAFAKLLL